MSLNIMICEDEPECASIISQFCHNPPDFRVVNTVYNGKDLFSKINKEINVLTLDIKLPDINGITMAKKIRQIYPHLKIIIITAHQEYHKDAFQIYVYDYISKFEITNRLPETLTRIKHEYKNDTINKRIKIRVNQEIVYLKTSDIIAVKSECRKIRIVTDKNEYLINNTLKNMYKKLGKNHYRCHRSFIVNLKAIKSIMGNRDNCKTVLSNDITVPVSRNKVKHIRDLLKKLSI